TLPATMMRPRSGSQRPAMERRSVVLPAPERPSRMVTPGWAVNATSSWKHECGPAAYRFCTSTCNDGFTAGFGNETAARLIFNTSPPWRLYRRELQHLQNRLHG